jgi:regulator of protease activity HflC (stomatin/prohibitin superfamily)
MNDYFKKNRSNGNNNWGKGDKNPFEPPEFFKNMDKKTSIIYSIIAIIVVLVLIKPYVMIKSGEVGIKVTAGKFEPMPLNAGIHFYIPGVQQIIIVDTKVRVINYKNLKEVNRLFDEGIRNLSSINVLDKRGLTVGVDLTVQYKLKPVGAPQTIATWGLTWEDKIINPVVRDVVRNVIGSFTAEELPINRNKIATMIDRDIRLKIDKLENKPVTLSSVQLREIVLPPKIKEQIEKVQIARQEAERAKYEVERSKQEAAKHAALAKGKADAQRIEAQGQADAVRIKAEEQAKANIMISKSLTQQLLTLRQIEVQGKFNEALKTNKDARIFLTPGGAVPNIWVDTKTLPSSSIKKIKKSEIANKK